MIKVTENPTKEQLTRHYFEFDRAISQMTQTPMTVGLKLYLFEITENSVRRGAALCTYQNDITVIDTIYIYQPSQRRGLGKKLVDEILQFARDRNCELAAVSSLACYQNKDFWLKCGFFVIGEVEMSPKYGKLTYFIKRLKTSNA